MREFSSESPVMYAIAFLIIAFIAAQSLFFIVKSWKHGKELGISKETLVSTVTSSILFTIAPAISILVTVFALANALGVVLPWIRLTVIGNLAYETTAAENALSVLGGSLSNEVTDKNQFATVAWAMTIGASFPLVFLPIVSKKLQKKIGGAVSKDEKSAKVGDIIAAAAFIGIISSFIARAINGASVMKDKETNIAVVTESAGLLSICTLISAIVFLIILLFICKKVSWGDKAEPFAMPIAMFGAMGMAILISKLVPDSPQFVWYPIGESLKTIMSSLS